jgi:hypothetical protein
MHYKNGREAKDGDFVIVEEGSQIRAGKIHSLVAGCDTCNCQVSYPVMGGTSGTCTTISKCYHAEDAYKAIEELNKPKESAQDSVTP